MDWGKSIHRFTLLAGRYYFAPRCIKIFVLDSSNCDYFIDKMHLYKKDIKSFLTGCFLVLTLTAIYPQTSQSVIMTRTLSENNTLKTEECSSQGETGSLGQTSDNWASCSLPPVHSLVLAKNLLKLIEFYTSSFEKNDSPKKIQLNPSFGPYCMFGPADRERIKSLLITRYRREVSQELLRLIEDCGLILYVLPGSNKFIAYYKIIEGSNKSLDFTDGDKTITIKYITEAQIKSSFEKAVSDDIKSEFR